MQVDEFPHASLIVHFLVTTVGHVPVDTSIYVTVVIPQASDMFPLFGALSKTASVEVAIVKENGGFVIAPGLHPSMVRVTAQVVTVGDVVSFTLIVWIQVDEFPHASLIVHFLVTTVGQVPLDTSIYVTVVIPHASEMLPLFGELSKRSEDLLISSVL